MPWFKLDDQGAFHAKVIAAGNEAYGAWCRGGQWSCAHLTEGRIPRSTAFTIARTKVWAHLVAVGLCESLGDDGFQIHDFLHWNPSADEVRDKRSKRAVAGRKGGLKSGETRRRDGTRASPEDADRAHSQVNLAIKRGDLIPAPCEKCGAPATQAHHDDYSRPLDVRWLCKPHHDDVHVAIRRSNRATINEATEQAVASLTSLGAGDFPEKSSQPDDRSGSAVPEASATTSLESNEAIADSVAKQKRTPFPFPFPEREIRDLRASSSEENFEKRFSLGTAGLVEAEGRYNEAVGEALGHAVAISIRIQEREDLASALNTYFLTEGRTKPEAISAMARRVVEWVREVVGSGQDQIKFASGWKPSRFLDWLNGQPPEAKSRWAGSPLEPTTPAHAGHSDVTAAEADAELADAIAGLQSSAVPALLREVQGDDVVGSDVRLVIPKGAA